jgi:hypothetical protein
MRLKTLSRQKQRSRGNRNPPNDEILTFIDDTAEKTGVAADRPLDVHRVPPNRPIVPIIDFFALGQQPIAGLMNFSCRLQGKIR